MSLKNICIEVRKQLFCINVFLQFEEGLEDAAALLRINVKPDQLSLHNNKQEVHISLQQYFNLEADTLSGLIIEQHNACFRLRIDNVQYMPSMSTPVKIIPVLNNFFSEDSDLAISIVCANCKSQLNNATDSSEQKFARYREFPSSGVHFDELFCHNAPKFDDLLVPRTTDLFYGFEFIVLNEELLKAKTREKEQQIYCGRCLQHLGETMLDQRAVKLWTDVLKVRTISDFEPIFVNNMNMKPTAHFLQKVMRDCCLLEEQTWMSKAIANVKVLVFATSADRIRHYLLLHILEQQLPVLLNLSTINNENPIKLTSYLSFKLLFQHITEDAEKQNKRLLDSWQGDISIQSLHISPKLFINLLEEMQSNALLLPETYRYTNVDDFQLSYIFY